MSHNSVKIFDSIRAAYSGSCRICHKPLNIPNIVKLKLLDEDIIYFNQDTGDIIEFQITETASFNGIRNVGSSNPLIFAALPQVQYSYNSIFTVSHVVSCYKCAMYDYTLQLFIDLNNKKVVKIALLSEFVSINYDNDENVYEIENSYSEKLTKYTHVSPNLNCKAIVLPLISDSFENPDEVLKRIKTLLVFS